MGLSLKEPPTGPLTKKEKERNKKKQQREVGQGQGSNIEGNLRTGRAKQQRSRLLPSQKDAIYKSVDNPVTPKPKTKAMYGQGQVKDVSTKLKEKKKKQLALKKATKNMNMGGVMKNRGGTFKGIF
jgi:hypothetical protein